MFSITEAKILAKKKRKLVFVLKFVSSLVGRGGILSLKKPIKMFPKVFDIDLHDYLVTITLSPDPKFFL